MNTFEENAGRIARSMGAAARQVADPVPVLVGEVVSAAPLKVRLNGMTQEGAALRVNAALLAGADGLQAGDQVAAFTLDRQTYYILCKVVRP